MVIPRLLLLVFFMIVLPLPAVHARDYDFDGKISRPVLENYLSRSITMLDLLTGKGDVDENIRMLHGVYLHVRPRTFSKNVKPYPKTDVWYHLVGTYDGKRVRFYVNGKLDGEQLAETPGLRIFPDSGAASRT